MKKIIIYTLVTAVMMPIVGCTILAFRVRDLNQRLDDLTVQIENMNRVSMEQQKQLEQWMTQNTVEGQGDAVRGQAALGGAVVGSLVEDTQAEQASAQEVQAAHKVYLTFDDGPSTFTDEILAILDRYQVKATFFVVGKENAAAEEAMRAIVEAGHTIGLHSYQHKYAEIYRSEEDFATDFTQIQDYVYRVTGVKSTIYRFPGGSSNTVSKLDMGVFIDYLDREGVRFYDWNISSQDAGSRLLDVQTLVKNCTADIQNYETSIILMHDSADKSTTVEALPIVIENILAMEDTVILPITEDTVPVHHIDTKSKE